MEKKVFAILSLLDTWPHALSSTEVARHLKSRGIDLAERTVRHYLKMLEAGGYATGGRKRGKRLTEKGRQELQQGFVSERVGFSISRINNLSFQCDLNIDTWTGRVILNVAFVPEEKAQHALSVLTPVLNSPYSTTSRIILKRSGQMIGDMTVPDGCVGIGQVCSITVNGILLKAGIPVYSRLGGLVEVRDHRPTRFLSAISYESSSVAPLELFMKARMTDVLGAARNGSGVILGSFREIPEASLDDARRLNEKMKKRGFRGIVVFGRPGEHLLGIPVTPDKAGMVVLGGLNPISALEEMHIPAYTRAMATLAEYRTLRPIEEVDLPFDAPLPETPVLMEHLQSRRGLEARSYWSILSQAQQSTR